MTYFSELGLAEPILRALAAKGYDDPTPIQRQSIPALLEGRDLLGIAQTGTGKTAAFSLPSLHRLAADPKPHKPASCRMLVLSPTRELAAQIAENMRGYAKFLRLQVDCVFGGMPVGKQARRLVPGTDILVATPGRLLDLVDQRALTLGRVEIFVLDEADQMMDLGFIHALKRVANLLPAKRQSLFFSATMPKAIADLGRQFIHDPVRVEVTPQATTAERVEQYVTFVSQSEKQALLTLRLKALLADGSLDRALVFTRTKHGADRVVRHLAVAGVHARAIHGNKTQAQRTAALEAFRQGSSPVLVATDIAARGIDVSGVSHVFNFELPNVPEQYVHRIGRTARAGADGVAMSFCAPDEKVYLRDIEKLTGVKLEAQGLPENFIHEAARLAKPTRRQPVEGEARPARAPHHNRSQGERGQGERCDSGRRDEGRRFEGRGDERRREGGEGRAPRQDRPRYDGPRQDGAYQDRPRGDRQRPEGERRERPQGERRDGERAYQPRGEQSRGGNDRGGNDRGGADRGTFDRGGDGQQKRRFRPRGAPGVGKHRGAVKRNG